MKRGLFLLIAIAFSTAVSAQNQNPPTPAAPNQPVGTISGFSSGTVSGFTPNAVSGFTPNAVQGFSSAPVSGFQPRPRSSFQPGTLTPLSTPFGRLGTNNFLATPGNPAVSAPLPAVPPLPQPQIESTNPNRAPATPTPLF